MAAFLVNAVSNIHALPNSITGVGATRCLFALTDHLRALSFQPTSPSGLFDKILIANRGEIACRVIKTAKRLGIKTVAVYSEADRNSAHVQQADEAVCVGPASPLQSYLNTEAILHAVSTTGAQAVHPGYGFLSENASFVDALERQGATFIGPPAAAIAALGDKVESKRIAHQAKISTIPGWVGEVRDTDHAAEVAAEIGYPVMIKASAGGGGKGMRFVWSEKELREQLPQAKAEAHNAFGSSALLIEKFVEGARHIEVQVLGDRMGRVLYLPERDCSVQRRNQKVVEESPSPFVTPKMRAEMGSQAVALAQAVGYHSTGTVEFVVDRNHNFYFLEMNTRLQVEHPVTEAVTGLDLVEAMIRVAAGQPLELTQEQAANIKGWAIESRVYAEDPARNFLPSPGTIKHLVEPHGQGVRLDTGVSEGAEISMHYDPMISKLITWGPTRKEAIRGMGVALDRYVVRGVGNNVAFLRRVIDVPAFKEGAYDTTFIPHNFPNAASLHPKNFSLPEKRRHEVLAAAAYLHVSRQLAVQPALLDGGGEVELVLELGQPEGHAEGNWGALEVGVRRAREDMVGAEAASGGSALEIEVEDKCVMQVVGQPLPHPHYPAGSWSWRPPAKQGVTAYTPFLHLLTINGNPHYIQEVDVGLCHLTLQHCGAQRRVAVHTPRSAELLVHMLKHDEADGNKILKSPMTGTVVGVLVLAGQKVETGDEAFVVEAMKMRNSVRVEAAGVVGEVKVEEGQVVAADQVMMVLE